MPVIAVINRKGGSGKSTMATHLAAWLARAGKPVMLGDVDRQQSTRTWLKRRDAALPAIVPWAMDQKNVLKVPAGVTHVVLDTPGGIHGFELSKLVMSADAIVMPVCSSIFDRESAASCIAELMAMPRLANGRCKLGIVGMRIDARTRAADALREWAEDLNVPFLGALRETQLYVRSLDQGLTVFDLKASTAAADLVQWEPILEWLSPFTQAPVLAKVQALPKAPEPIAVTMPPPKPLAERIPAPRAASLMPAQESMVHGSRLSIFATTRTTLPPQSDEVHLVTQTGMHDHSGVPQFLLRH